MTGRAASAVLHPSMRAWLGVIAGLSALVVAAIGVLVAGGGEAGAVDRWVQSAVGDAAAPWRSVALAVDFWGEPAGAATLVVVAMSWCLAAGQRRAAVVTVAGGAVTVGATTLLKPLVGRTIHGGNLSYPSGHTAFFTAIALAVALLVTSRRRGGSAGTLLVLGAALVAGTAMGWAQVALGAHYPTDVVGGLFAALAVVPVTAHLVDLAADRMGAGRAGGGRAARR
ncbi:phosphatase PAP2 family protein [Streptomyces sp. B5E4]|uniref:phosphatase PAP2 family protein n=1 Tax=Streptomyces sp. B5E4 TaxID=3153568 RepID=UPI00325E3F66